MIIEVGKLYRCRDKTKARIYAIDGLEGTIHGAVWYKNIFDETKYEGWVMRSWLACGRWSITSKPSSKQEGYDIVSEWVN